MFWVWQILTRRNGRDWMAVGRKANSWSFQKRKKSGFKKSKPPKKESEGICVREATKISLCGSLLDPGYSYILRHPKKGALGLTLTSIYLETAVKRANYNTLVHHSIIGPAAIPYVLSCFLAKPDQGQLSNCLIIKWERTDLTFHQSIQLKKGKSLQHGSGYWCCWLLRSLQPLSQRKRLLELFSSVDSSFVHQPFLATFLCFAVWFDKNFFYVN